MKSKCWVGFVASFLLSLRSQPPGKWSTSISHGDIDKPSQFKLSKSIIEKNNDITRCYVAAADVLCRYFSNGNDPLRVFISCLTLTSCRRFRLDGGPIPPSPRAKNCTFESGVNWGTGGKEYSVSSAGDCCDICAEDPTCGCWDLNPSAKQCWIKTNCSQKVKADRISGRLPLPPSPPGPADVPPQAYVNFNDSSWAIVDAPHDMLINQKFDAKNSKSSAYLPRFVWRFCDLLSKKTQFGK